MGRPLNKKYFGNRNSVAVNNGSSVLSAEVSGGSYTTRPTLTFTAPQLPGGVVATATITSQVNMITTIGDAGTDYSIGDTISIGNGTEFTVDTVGTAGEIQALTITKSGSYPYAAGVLPSGSQTTTNILVSDSLATGAKITVNYSAKETVITEHGSGYTAAPTAATGPTQSVVLGTVNLSANSGGTGTPEAAIIARAYIDGALCQVDIVRQVSTDRYRISIDKSLESSVIGKLKTTGDASAEWPNSEGVEMNIIAFDSDGGTYYVKKLTAKKAVLVPAGVARFGSSAGTQFPLNADGSCKQVPWTLNAESGAKVMPAQLYLQSGVNVKIENA